MKLKADLSRFKADPDLEQAGRWVELPEGLKVLVRRAGGANLPFKQAMNKTLRPHRRKIERGTMDPVLMEELVMDVFVKTVVVDWEGFIGEDGEEIPYTEANAKEFFREYPEFYQDAVSVAQEMGYYTEESIRQAREDLGKS